MKNPLKSGPALIIGLIIAGVQAIAKLIKAIKKDEK